MIRVGSGERGTVMFAGTAGSRTLKRPTLRAFAAEVVAWLRQGDSATRRGDLLVVARGGKVVDTLRFAAALPAWLDFGAFRQPPASVSESAT